MRRRRGCEGGVWRRNDRVVPQFDKADVILVARRRFPRATKARSVAESARVQRSPRLEADGENKMNRLYVAENRFTVTGGMADHRLRVPVESDRRIRAGELAAEIFAEADEGRLARRRWSVPIAKKSQGEIRRRSGSRNHREGSRREQGKSLVLVGARQPAAVQALGVCDQLPRSAISARRWSAGKSSRETSGCRSTHRLWRTREGNFGEKKISSASFIVGGNPVYNAALELDFVSLLKNATCRPVILAFTSTRRRTKSVAHHDRG